MALNVNVDSASGSSVVAEAARRGLEKAAQIAAAADVNVNMVSRYDISISSGIIHTIKEYSATDVIIGLHQKAGFLDSFFGALTNNLLKGTNLEVMVARFTMPLNTVKGISVIVPPGAEYETGFPKWTSHICRMAAQLGCKTLFISENSTTEQLRRRCRSLGVETSSRFGTVDRLSLQDQMAAHAGSENVLVVVSARSGSISYDSSMERIPQYLAKNASIGNFIILYPEQVDLEDMVSFSDPMGNA